MGKWSVETIRGMVKGYCAEHKMRQSDFGDMVGVNKSSFSRFMGAGRETTGKGSESYIILNRFFQKQKRDEAKGSKAQASAPRVLTHQQSHGVGTECPKEKENQKRTGEEYAAENAVNDDVGPCHKKSKVDSSSQNWLLASTKQNNYNHHSS